MSIFQLSQSSHKLNIDLPKKAIMTNIPLLYDSAISKEADFLRVGDDLVVKILGDSYIIHNYFVNPVPLKTIEGIVLSPNDITVLLSNNPEPILLAANDEGNSFVSDSALKQIGTITTVIEESVTALNKEGISRTLNEGDPVYLYDTIVTGKESYVKIVLNDGTLFQFGPYSRASLDKYIYDPDDSEGEFEAFVYSGGFRYISGKISGDNMGQHTVIKTPSAYIGIRGSEIDAVVSEDGSTTILHFSGLVSVFSQYQVKEILIYERGTSVHIPNENISPSIQQLTEEQLQQNDQDWQIFEYGKPEDTIEEITPINPSKTTEDTSIASLEKEPVSNSDISKNEDNTSADEDNTANAESTTNDVDSIDDNDTKSESTTNDADSIDDNDTKSESTNDTDNISDAGARNPFSSATVDTNSDESVDDIISENIEAQNTQKPPFKTSVPQPVSEPTNEADINNKVTTIEPADEVSKIISQQVLEFNEDNPQIIQPLGNITQFTQPKHGEVVNNDDGTLTYIPSSNFNGQDNFTYITSKTGSVFVKLTIIPVNDAPIAIDDSAFLDEKATLTLSTTSLIQNDQDIEGDALHIVGIENPENGTVTLDKEEIVFIPTDNFTTGGFNYIVSDGEKTDIGHISIASLPKTLLELEVELNEDESKTIQSISAETDDIIQLIQPENGEVIDNSDGTLMYTPLPNFNGQDNFTYTINETDTVFVKLTIAPVNDAPKAVDDILFLNGEATLAILATSLTENDEDIEGNILTVIGVENSENGSVVLSEDKIIFTPTNNFIMGGFDYIVSDGEKTDIGHISITSKFLELEFNEDTSSTIQALSDETRSITQVTQPVYGEVLNNENGILTYIPVVNFNGEDNFTYIINGTEIVFVRLTITPVNDAPQAVDDSISFNNETALTISADSLIENDQDVDGDVLSVVTVENPENGFVILNDGKIVFTLNESSTTGGFDYLISDGEKTDTAHVNITKENPTDPPNNPPVIKEDVSINMGNKLFFTISVAEFLKEYVSDPDGDPLTLSAIDSWKGGEVKIDNGYIKLTRDTKTFDGTGGFEYQVSDDKGGVTMGEVTIVGDINLPPDTIPDKKIISKYTPFLELSFSELLGNDQGLNNTFTITDVDVGKNFTHEVQLDTEAEKIIFTPKPDGFVGNVSFKYVVSDNLGVSSTGEVSIIVSHSPPTAKNDPDSNVELSEKIDKFYTLEGQEKVILVNDLLANDSDPDDGKNVKFVEVVDNSETPGTVVYDHDSGHIIFKPDDLSTQFVEENVSFFYTIEDPNGAQETATVTVTVYKLSEDDFNPVLATKNKPVTISQESLLTNDKNQGEGLKLTLTEDNKKNAKHGEIVQKENGDIEFIPENGYDSKISGDEASFNYTVIDQLGKTDTATVTLTVTNSQPIAENYTFHTTQNNEWRIFTDNLPKNDPDPNDEPIVTEISDFINGTARLEHNEIVFIPNDPFLTKEASFKYTVTDGSAESATATVNIDVAPIPPQITLNSEPLPYNINVIEPISVVIDNNVSVNDLDSPNFDGGELQVAIAGSRSFNDVLEIQNTDSIKVSSQTEGEIFYENKPIGNFLTHFTTGALLVSLNANADHDATNAILQATTYKYTSTVPPENNIRTIELTLNDGDGGISNVETRNIEITTYNSPPVAKNDSLDLPFNTPVAIPISELLSNDTDANPTDTLSVSELSRLGEGIKAEIVGNEVQLFIDALLKDDYSEPVTFDYTVNDGKENSEEPATVTVTPSNIKEGTSADDNLKGTNEPDILLGKEGNDTFEQSVGPDILLGDSNDDLFLFDPKTAAGTYIDGGSDTDILRLSEGNKTLDLIRNDALPADQKFELDGIETIELTSTTNLANNNNQLRLSIKDVLDITDSKNTLIVEGDTTNIVNSVGQGWRDDGIDSTGLYHSYSGSYDGTEATLLVNTDITSQLIS
ncbi:Ig-like domain-containing protein [Candidatus Parabeggiatoa sp. HSG14]|uniref:Ig-like domain-containing protein n=1 Tax=Candidatus Parabeggiatoa sp. HSG14 TaxID=3055593 RepID=UPI0025A8DC85|nr:tandem-95 repeat protein [Thiotrichales bacterium HSG14]